MSDVTLNTSQILPQFNMTAVLPHPIFAFFFLITYSTLLTVERVYICIIIIFLICM